MSSIARVSPVLFLLLAALQGGTAIAADATRDSSQAPLVVKNRGNTEAGEKLIVTGVSPSPIIGSKKPQRLIIKGSGFTKGSRVALSRSGQIEVWPSQEIAFLSSERLAVNVITGEQGADWSVMVGGDDKRTSNLFAFSVISPLAHEHDRTSVTKAAVRPANEGSGVKALSKEGGHKPKLFGTGWLAAQPKEHYSLQLLASHSRLNLMMFVHANPTLAPLAAYTREQNGSTLYVLTMGSYRSRIQADEAANALPPGLNAWPRLLATVQQVMQQDVVESDSVTTKDSSEKMVFKDSAWVWSQNPAHYTVQLAAAGSVEAIEAAVRRMGIAGELVVLQLERRGKPWYAWLQGSYASRAEADAMIQRLPELMRQSKPWVRSFGNVQDELSQ